MSRRVLVWFARLCDVALMRPLMALHVLMGRSVTGKWQAPPEFWPNGWQPKFLVYDVRPVGMTWWERVIDEDRRRSGEPVRTAGEIFGTK